MMAGRAAVAVMVVAAGIAGAVLTLAAQRLGGGASAPAVAPEAAAPAGTPPAGAPPLEAPDQPLVGVWPGVQVDEEMRRGVSDGLLALLNAYVTALRAADPSPLDGAAVPPARDSLAQVVRDLGGQGFVVEELSVTPVIVDVRGDVATVQLELYVKGAPAAPGQDPPADAPRREGVFRWYVGFRKEGNRYVASALTGAPEMPWRQPGAAVPAPSPAPSGGGR